MKKILFLSLIALSALSANAQTEKEAAAAAKQAAKEMKAKAAADLKAFKEKQKAELAAFVETQKNGPATAANTPIVTKEDSIAHIYGTALSRGLKEYATQQLGVDSTMIQEFTEGILKSINADPKNLAQKAFSAGENIGNDIVGKTGQFSSEYFAAEPEKSMNAKIVGEALIAALLEKSDILPDDAGVQLNNIMQERKKYNDEKLYGPNREAGEKFLAENKSKEGVVTLPSGLQYKVITMGDGEKPKRTDKVSVNYEGKLLDGTVFDSSYKRGKPASFGVTQVIKGWTEALMLMPVGSKWELYIPQELAYGERNQGNIKPYSMLTFVVELLGIESKEEAKPATTKPATKANTKTTAKKK